MIPTVSLTEINGVAPIELSPIYFNLVSLLPITANQYNDIAPVFGLWYVNWLLVMIILSLLAIIAMAIIMWKKKKYDENDGVIQQETDPPIVIAMNRIDGVKKTLNNDPAHIKQCYFELTEIFCTYITDETKINVLDATTVEMNRLLKQAKSLSSDRVMSIINASKEMDHHKFSQTPDLSRKTIDSIIQQLVSIMKGFHHDFKISFCHGAVGARSYHANVFRSIKVTHTIRFPKAAWMAPLKSKKQLDYWRFLTG